MSDDRRSSPDASLREDPLMLTAEQLQAREGKLTASRVAALMTGDAAKIMNLWREMVGDPSFVPDDLSDVWPVQLGNATEALNLEWYERKQGDLTRKGEVVCHPLHDWAACTLDGFDPVLPGPVECKHVGGWEPRETIIDRYSPQIHWQMICTGTYRAALSIIEGAREPVIEPIDFDAKYAAELFRRAESFMECVWSLTPPVAGAPIAAPIKATIVIDMAGSNEWGDCAATWLETHASAKKAASAEKSLKALVPAEAAKAFGAGVAITRDRAGRLSLRRDDHAE